MTLATIVINGSRAWPNRPDTISLRIESPYSMPVFDIWQAVSTPTGRSLAIDLVWPKNVKRHVPVSDTFAAYLDFSHFGGKAIAGYGEVEFEKDLADIIQKLFGK